MDKETYQQLMMEWTNDLPLETVIQVTEYIYFLRTRQLRPKAFEEDIKDELLRMEVRNLSRNEQNHLEKELTEDKVLSESNEPAKR
jgi:hypothetical protein